MVERMKLKQNDPPQKPTSLVLAMRDFFGMRPGTGVREFAEEIRALDPEDRSWFKTALRGVGYDIKTE